MFSGARLPLIVLLIVLLAAVGAWASAQSPQVVPDAPFVVSGSDLGFRVEGRRGSDRVGRLVVRIDGRWVEALPAAGIVPLTTR